MPRRTCMFAILPSQDGIEGKLAVCRPEIRLAALAVSRALITL